MKLRGWNIRLAASELCNKLCQEYHIHEYRICSLRHSCYNLPSAHVLLASAVWSGTRDKWRSRGELKRRGILYIPVHNNIYRWTCLHRYLRPPLPLLYMNQCPVMVNHHSAARLTGDWMFHIAQFLHANPWNRHQAVEQHL